MLSENFRNIPGTKSRYRRGFHPGPRNGSSGSSFAGRRNIRSVRIRQTTNRVREGSTWPLQCQERSREGIQEAWTGLTPGARSLVGTLWAEKTGVDLVVTTLDL